MSLYINNILIGVAAFPFVAFFITVPYMIYQYRRFGSIPWWRTFLFYILVLYLLCAYFLVILPLPTDFNLVVSYAQTPQLVPFNFIQEIANNIEGSFSNPGTWIQVVVNPAFYEALFNVVLLIPFGALLRYYLKRTWYQALALGFCLTLFFELSQLTGLFGIYSHPYRLFDIDDLILNTLGAMVGFWLVGPATKKLPNMAIMNQEAYDKGLRASFIRRLLSFAIDIVMLSIIAVAIKIVFALLGAQDIDTLFTYEQYFSLPLTEIVAFLIIFVVVPVITQGQTIGQKLVRLKVTRPDAERARWYHFLSRYTLLFLIAYIVLVFPNAFLTMSENEAAQLGAVGGFLWNNQGAFALVWLTIVVLWAVFLIVRNQRAKKQHRPFVLLNELASDTRIYTTRQAHDVHERQIVLSMEDVFKLENMLDEKGVSRRTIVFRAGNTIADAIKKRYPEPTPTAIACGPDNGGAIGWVIAERLAKEGYPVKISSIIPFEQLILEPSRSIAAQTVDQAYDKKWSLSVVDSLEEFEGALQTSTIIVDALLGSRFTEDVVEEPYRSWIESINKEHERVSKRFVVSIDVPSGFSAETGKAANPTVVADLTITILVYKQGLLTEEARSYCGTIHLAKMIDMEEVEELLQELYEEKERAGKAAGSNASAEE